MINIKIKAIEIIQSIQNLNNDIPLVQDKLTYIRYYLSCDQDEVLKINGVMKVSIIDAHGKSHELTTLNNTQPSTVKYENKDDDLNVRRLCWGKSLNFKLPQNFLAKYKKNTKDSVSVKFELVENEIKSINDKKSSAKIKLDNTASSIPPVMIRDFKKVVVNLRAVAYRFVDVETGEINEPSQGELRVIKDYIESAFPISKLNWSTITIDAPREFKQLNEVLQRNERTDESLDKVYTFLFQHLLAIRNQDISFSPKETQLIKNDTATKEPTPWEQNTLYLGVLSDPKYQIVGSAMDSPAFVTPHVVAFCGTVSYGELGAHELAHMLGELHPGIPGQDMHGKYLGQKRQFNPDSVGNQDVNSGDMNSLGKISNSEHADKMFVGLDSQIKSSMPNLLSADEYFDLMTYRFPKWLGAHTYKSLLKRLSALSNFESKPAEFGEYYWNVVGDYDLANKTAKIHYMLRSEFPIENPHMKNEPDSGKDSSSEDDAVADNFKLNIQYAQEDDAVCTECHEYKLSKPEPIYLRRNLEKSDNSIFIGVFQHTIHTKNKWPPKYLTLSINDNKVDVFDPGNEPDLVKNILQDLIDSSKPDLSDSSNSMTETVVGLGKSLSASQPRGNNSDQNKNKIRLKYSVDKGGFYLRFNWTKLDKNGDPDPSNASTDDISSLLYNTAVYKIPIITTIQMKANLSEESTRNSTVPQRWQTVAITSRLQEEYWISPDFTLLLSSHDQAEKLLSPHIKVRENISDFDNEFKSLGIRFRVCITLMGEGLVIFDSEKHDSVKNIINNPGVSIESFGSKGLDQINFYHPYTTDYSKNDRVAADKDNDKHSRLFYRADV